MTSTHGRARRGEPSCTARAISSLPTPVSPVISTAASLRAIEIEAQLLLKATKVNGIYSADPLTDPKAILYPRLTFDRVLSERLNVMDATAIVMCRDHQLPLRVFNLNEPGQLLRIVSGEDLGTLVTND